MLLNLNMCFWICAQDKLSFFQVEDELHLSVPEGLADSTAVRAEEVVGHVRVEVDVVLLTDEVPLLGS